MNHGKLLLAAIGATVLLGALVSSTSARNLSLSTQTRRVTWTRMDFVGGFGTVECEVVLRASFHSRATAKVLNSLVGYVTEGRVSRCRRGSATINTASFPWHVRYGGYGGTLPNITSVFDRVTGAEWRIREPTFGITCTIDGATSAMGFARTIMAGVLTRLDVSGTCDCDGISGTFSGSTTSIDNGAGARLTLTLI